MKHRRGIRPRSQFQLRHYTLFGMRDWVVIYWDGRDGERQCTVVTERRGELMLGAGMLAEFRSSEASWYDTVAVLFVVPCALLGASLSRPRWLTWSARNGR